MIQYSLEKHLEQLCKEHPEYVSLVSTWNLNKATCTDALKTVVASYPHFSLHDVSHAEAVITKIEMLLGDRVEKLSPTDTWLILHSAYAHDLGMVLKWEDIEKIWKEPKFAQFLKRSMESLDTEICKAAKNIYALLNRAENVCFDPLKISREVTLINAAYFRKYHSEISRKYIDLWENGLGIDFGHSGLIQSRLVKLLGLICELHTADADQVLKMDYQTDGFGADYAHPRFVAMMLRLGDLLDADNGRFSKTNIMAIGDIPDSSLSHKDKHESTTHLLVTPSVIEFRSDCPNQNSYLETRNFITWLESEIDFLKKNWDLIAPKGLGGYVPRFDKKEVLIKGVPDIEGVAGLRFKISQEKAFQIVEGSNIYGDPFVCFREIIQNAMDASKIQMWKDLTAGNYAAWIPSEKVTKNAQPYDIDKSIFDNYAVYVELSTLDDGRTQVDISDRGTGISATQFKQMCNVGSSASINGANEVFVETMPNWLKPTAGFGIGLQSIFLLVDEFEIITSTGTEAFEATVHSHRAGGYLQLQRKDNVSPRGTTIRMRFDATKHRQPLIEKTRQYIYGQYDRFADENYIGECKVIGAIAQNCGDLMFPVHVVSSIDKRRDTVLINALSIDSSRFCEKKEQIRFSLSKDCCVFVAWDERYHMHAEIRLVERRNARTEIRFKGVRVSRAGGGRREGLNITLDVFGLETKKTLALDRKTFINPGATIIKDRTNAMVQFYIDRVLDELNSSPDRLVEICDNEKFNVYTLWLLCSAEQRDRIPSNCYSYMRETAEIVTLLPDGKYVLSAKPVKDILTYTGELYYARYRNYQNVALDDRAEIHQMCDLLNQYDFNEVKEIVVDGLLQNASDGRVWESMIKPIKGENLFIYTTGHAVCCKVSDEFRREIICGLVRPIPEMSYYGLLAGTAKYFAIPAISGYEDIVTAYATLGVASPNIYTNMIIAPFTSQLGGKTAEMSKDMFVSSVMEDERFDGIVTYVHEKRIKQSEITLDEIKECYQKLIEEFYDVVTTHDNDTEETSGQALPPEEKTNPC